MSGGVPPSSRAKTRSAMSKSKLVQKAALLYERFSGHEAEAIGKIKVPPMPTVGVAIGDIDGVLYTTIRDGRVEKYIHKFKAKDKPLFVVSPNGKQLYMVGGHYDFTERGIVDKSDVKNRSKK